MPFTKDSPGSDIYGTHAWKKLRQKRLTIAKDYNEPCYRCRKPIDYELSGNHKWGPVIDHIEPIGSGGEELPPISLLAPSHRHCNNKHGARLGRAIQNGHTPRARHTPSRPTTDSDRQQSGRDTPSPTNTERDSQAASRNTPAQSTTDSDRQGYGSFLKINTNSRLPKGIPARDPDKGPGTPVEAAGASEGLPRGPASTREDGAVTGGYRTPPSPLQGGHGPRFFSDPHPEAVGTYADEWVDWYESEVGESLRPWQRMVADRSLEYREDGSLCWTYVVVSTPRQSGKSVLFRALAVMRAQFAVSVFGEPATVVHTANNVQAGHRIMRGAWRWAEDAGLVVRRGQGSQEIEWPDGSRWALSSLKAIYGFSGSVALVDEAWDVPLSDVEAALVPVLVERASPQLFIASTANLGATELLPRYKRKALEGDSSVMLADWGARPDDDPFDPVVWESATPHWSEQRGRFMEAQKNGDEFRQQYLNLWTADIRRDKEWPLGWASADPAGDFDATVGALESHDTRDRFAATVGVRDEDGFYLLRTRQFTTIEASVGWLEGQGVATVAVGASIASYAVGNFVVQKVGSSETSMATGLFDDLIRRGLVLHNHDGDTSAETPKAKVVRTDRGLMLSGKQSKGPVCGLKSQLWCCHLLAADTVEAPAIW